MATENRHHDENATPSLDGRGAARRRLTKVGAGALLTLGSRGALAGGPTCLTPSGFWSSGLNPAKSNYGPQACTGGRSPGYWKQSQHAWPAGMDPATYAFTMAFPMASAAACPAPAMSDTGNGRGNNGNGRGNNGNGNNGNGNGNNGNGNGNNNNNGNHGNGNNGNGNGNGGNGDTTPAPPTSYECALLADMLEHQGFDADNLGMHMAATYLNIQAGLVTFLTVAQLREIWNEVSSPGGVFHPTAGVDWSRADVVKYLQATMT